MISLRPLAEDADVERVAVAAPRRRREPAHAIAAIRPRHEAVQRQNAFTT